MKMMKRTIRYFWICALFLLAGGCAVQPSQSRYRVDLVSDFIMMFPNADHKETHVELTHRVLGEDEQGDLEVEVRIDSLVAGMQSLMIVLDYDDQADEGPIAPVEGDKRGNRPEKYRLSFTGLASLVYQAKVDRATGEVTLLDLPKRLEEVASGKVKGVFGGDQVSMVFSRANLKDYAAVGCNTNLDQAWFTHGQTIVPRAASVKTTRKILDREKGADPNHPRVTRVSFSLEKPEGDGGGAARKSGMKLSSFEGTGYLLQEKGWILRWEETLKAHVAIGGRSKARKKKASAYYLIKKSIQLITPAS